MCNDEWLGTSAQMFRVSLHFILITHFRHPTNCGLTVYTLIRGSVDCEVSVRVSRISYHVLITK